MDNTVTDFIDLYFYITQYYRYNLNPILRITLSTAVTLFWEKTSNLFAYKKVAR